MVHLKKDARVLLLTAIAVMAVILSPCNAEDKCYTVYRCTLPACNDYCFKLGVKNPQVTCKLSFPPSDYYDTCCCGTWDDKSVGARRLLSH
uniref:Bifunctional inhibitor/plant lipid transfer protein/seed storage helical domain-containing protein n=1 Tax=Oryza meridionalis TaxID=40149 RepID=A0A0E0EW17_9ORYZ